LALTDQNPYGAIPGRNVFSLKAPPISVATNTPTATPAPGIELQGFSTILGRPQVLLKLKVAAKPPEPAKDKAVVLDVGAREGDVEIVSMDAYAGTVTLKNQGSLVSLNLKDNAAKPTAGPALTPPAGFKPPGGIPAPTPSASATPNSGGASVATMGGTPALPTRNLRSGNPTAGTVGGGPGGTPGGVLGGVAGTSGNSGSTPQAQQPQRELSAEEGAALLEINRRADSRGLPYPPPRFKAE
jgi:hypothetical protein